jgi:hypothetical protein
MRNPKLVATGNSCGLPSGPPAESLMGGWFRSTAEWILLRWLFGRHQSVLLVETATRVV